MSSFDVFAVQVVEMYLAALGRVVKTQSIAKVLLLLDPAGRYLLDHAGRDRGKPEMGGNVCTICRPFDFVRFEGLERYAKRLAVLQVLHAGLIELAEQLQWGGADFERAFEICMKNRIEFSGHLVRSPLEHPHLPIMADIQFRFDDMKVHVDLVLLDKRRKVIAKRDVFCTLAHADVVRSLVGKAAWSPSGKSVRLLRLGPFRDAIEVDVSNEIAGYRKSR
jgi:hypothetical protein